LDYDALAAAPEKLIGLCRPARLHRILRQLRKTPAARPSA